MFANNSALTDGYDDPEPDVEPEDTPQPPHEARGEHQVARLTQPSDAAERNTQIPPKLVEDVQSNVELLRPVARSMAAINLHNLFVRIQHPATTNKDRLDFQAMLNKMSGLDAKEATNAGGAGFSITINIPQVGASPGNVIEAKATHVVEAETAESDE